MALSDDEVARQVMYVQIITIIPYDVIKSTRSIK